MKQVLQIDPEFKGDAPCVNLVTENSVIKRHDARYAFDESHMTPIVPPHLSRTAMWKRAVGDE